jgi:hypothetical protein
MVAASTVRSSLRSIETGNWRVGVARQSRNPRRVRVRRDRAYSAGASVKSVKPRAERLAPRSLGQQICAYEYDRPAAGGRHLSRSLAARQVPKLPRLLAVRYPPRRLSP